MPLRAELGSMALEDGALPPPTRSPARAAAPVRAKVFFNGKFYSAGLNGGVHRVADRLIREIDALAAERPELRERLDFSLLLPERRKLTPELRAIRLVEQRGGHSQWWEQFAAPGAARDGLLVNLCNLAPIAHPRKLTLIHDAQFYLFPSSYPLHFRVGYQILTPWMARSSLETLTVSEFSREMLSAFGVSPAGRTQVIYNGADHINEVVSDPGVLQRLGLERERYVLLFGALAPYKNIQVVLSAFEDPALEPLKLVIVGASEARLAEAGYRFPPGAVFASGVDDRVLRGLYEGALCLAYPSRTEGFGLPPLEAMNCGAPAVVSPAGAIPEICGDAALYAGQTDPASWVRAFLALLHDPALREEKRRLGALRAGAYTWRRAGETLLEAIERHA